MTMIEHLKPISRTESDNKMSMITSKGASFVVNYLIKLNDKHTKSEILSSFNTKGIDVFDFIALLQYLIIYKKYNKITDYMNHMLSDYRQDKMMNVFCITRAFNIMKFTDNNEKQLIKTLLKIK
jgi:hypothetical protein